MLGFDFPPSVTLTFLLVKPWPWPYLPWQLSVLSCWLWVAVGKLQAALTDMLTHLGAVLHYCFGNECASSCPQIASSCTYCNWRSCRTFPLSLSTDETYKADLLVVIVGPVFKVRRVFQQWESDPGVWRHDAWSRLPFQQPDSTV